MKQLAAQLTKMELSSILEIVHRSTFVSSDREFLDLLDDVCALVPVDHVVAGLGRKNRQGVFQGVMKLINHSYPEEWLGLYLNQGLAMIDPVFQSHLLDYRLQVWSRTYGQVRSRQTRSFVRQAKSFGLVDGITVGAPCRRHSGGSLFSFSGRELTREARHVSIVNYVAPHLHLALMRTAFGARRELPRLSLREHEVLQWMKEGKTNWEISQILRISERTAKFHVRNIMLKLDVNRRSHAVAVALEGGLIGLDSPS